LYLAVLACHRAETAARAADPGEAPPHAITTADDAGRQ